jgi:hypothetical protein
MKEKYLFKTTDYNVAWEYHIFWKYWYQQTKIKHTKNSEILGETICL